MPGNDTTMNATATSVAIPCGGPTVSRASARAADRDTGQITASFTAERRAAGTFGSTTEIPSHRLAQPQTAMIVTLACTAAKTPRASGVRSLDVSSTVNRPDAAIAPREITTVVVRPRAARTIDALTPSPVSPARDAYAGVCSADSIEGSDMRRSCPARVELDG